MTIVGTAEVLILPLTGEFEKALKDQTAPGLKTFQKDTADAGALAGANLRGGVAAQSGKLAGDLEKDGARGGEGLHRGLAGGMGKVSSLLSATGLPLGAFTQGLDRSAGAAEHLGSRSDGLGGKLDHLGGVAMAGVAASAVVLGGAALDVGVKMQGAEASIAAASGTSVAAAAKIGSAFTDTAFKSEFSAVQMAQAFGAVAGQLKATEGHALNSAQAMKVMSAADALATAKQIDLGTATSAVAGVMQAFSLKTGEASHVSDVLYRTSVATGQGVGTLAAQLEKVRSKLGDAGGSVGDLSALLVDMTDRGITGRAAMAALNTSMNTLQRTATGVQTAVQAQKTAFDGLSPQVQKLAKGYLDGSISSKQLTSDTSGLSTQQQALVSQFLSANKAVETAQQKYKNLGVTVFDQHGQFVGMRDIIEQLHGRFADMTQQQQLAAAATLFGAGAARQMVAIISAGPSAYDKASASVNKLGSAHDAAAKQSQTLKVELETLKAGAIDLAAKIGAFLIPIITTMVGWFTKATAFVLDHKAVLIALTAVVTGILGPAIAVFTINKMAAFAGSFKQASGHVKQFASDVEGVVGRVKTALQGQNSAATKMANTTQTQSAKASGAVKDQASATQASAGKIEGASAKAGAAAGTQAADTEKAATRIGTAEGTVATETTAAAGTVETENTSAGASYGAMAGESGTAAAGVGTAEATLAGEVTAADSTIESENAAAAASFAALDAAAAGGSAAAISGAAGVAGRSLIGVLSSVGGAAVASYFAAHALQSAGVIPKQGAPGTNVGGSSNLPQPGHPISGPGNIIDIIASIFGGSGPAGHNPGPGKYMGGRLDGYALGGLLNATGNRITQPTYMVGEEGAANPEFVIATNPQYRGRNVGLWAEAGKMMGIQGFAQGGVSAAAAAAHSGGVPSIAQAKAIITAAARKYGISPALLWGVYGVETDYGKNVTTSSAGAVGPFQFEPSTASSMGVNPYDFSSAAYGAARYLAQYQSRGTAGMLSAYNAGPAGGMQPGYVASVLADSKTYGSGPPVPVHVVKVAPEYVNPLGRATATKERTDQGKDFGNIKGPIQAVGEGIITAVYKNLSGFGQTVIEKLTSGSHKGEYLYYAMETGGRATIKSGAQVKAGETIGYGLGSGGVEFGQWNPLTGHAMGYVPGVTSGGATPAGTAYAAWIASLPKTAAPSSTTVVGQGPSPAQIHAQQLAQARAFVAKEIRQESASVERQIKSINAALKPHHPLAHGRPIDPLAMVHPTVEHSIKAHGEIDALTAALHIQIEAQRMAVGEKTVLTKAQLAEQTADLKAGAATFAQMASAVHSGKMSELVASLTAAHKEHLAKLEAALKGDQGTALAKLAGQLIKVHMEAQSALAAGQITEIKAMIAPRQETTLSATGHFGSKTVHASALEREMAGAGIAETRAGLHIHLQQQRRALGEHTSESKKEISRQKGDLGKGTAEMAKLVAAVHSGKMGEIKAALIGAHDAHLTTIEHDLHGDHSAALQKLNVELKAVHAQAMAQFVADSKAQAKAAAAATAAAAKAHAAAALAASDTKLSAHMGVVGAVASAQAAKIADATKLSLDERAEAGLTGAALTAAKAQVAYDKTAQTADTAVGIAQVKVAQAAAESPHAQAIAAAGLAAAQAKAIVAEAQAQSALDKANYDAQQAGSTPGATGTTPGVPDVHNNFTIIGQGLDANGVMAEITWALKTGALPVSPPLATVPA